MLAEDHGGKSRVHHGGASVDNSSVEQLSSGTVDRTPTNPASIGGSSVSCSFQGTVDCWETLQKLWLFVGSYQYPLGSLERQYKETDQDFP